MLKLIILFVVVFVNIIRKKTSPDKTIFLYGIDVGKALDEEYKIEHS